MLKGIDSGSRGILLFGLAIAACLVCAFFELEGNWRLAPALVGIACCVILIRICRRHRAI